MTDKDVQEMLETLDKETVSYHQVEPQEKIYVLPMSPSYVSHWDLTEAARELIQNARDHMEEFDYDLSPSTFMLTSWGASLDASTLVLGQSSKRNDEDSVGSFGEGYKLALLVLIREGYEVVVHNNGQCWVPFFEHDDHFGTEVLKIRATPYPESEGYLSFIISGLKNGDDDRIRKISLRMQPDVGEVIETSKGRILVDREKELYVGGLFVCKTDLENSYDIKPSHLALERDRQTVSDFDLKFLVKDMWFEVEDHEDNIAGMISRDSPDMTYAQYGTPPKVKQACFDLYEENYGHRLVAVNQSEADHMIQNSRMERTTPVVLGNVMGTIVKSAPAYQERVYKTQRPLTPQEILHNFRTEYGDAIRRMNKQARRALNELIEKSKDWRSN